MTDISDSNDPENWDIPGVSADHHDRMLVFRNYPRVKAAVLAYEGERFKKRMSLAADHVARYGHEGPYGCRNFAHTIALRPDEIQGA